MNGLMNTFCPIGLLGLWVLFTIPARAETLSNNVPVTDDLRLAVSDELEPTLQAIVQDPEVRADKVLHWILHSVSSNDWSTAVFPGRSNAFQFDLKTTNGTTIAKTATGEAMSSRLSVPVDPASTRLLRIGPGIRTFGKPTELFNFTSNGVYILEIRCWTLAQPTNTFVLSPAIRIRVVKD